MYMSKPVLWVLIIKKKKVWLQKLKVGDGKMHLPRLSRKGEKWEREALASLSDGKAWQIMLLEIINIDLNWIMMISDARATFLLSPSLPPSFTCRAQGSDLYSWAAAFLLVKNYSWCIYTALTNIHTVCEKYFSDWKDVKWMSKSCQVREKEPDFVFLDESLKTNKK